MFFMNFFLQLRIRWINFYAAGDFVLVPEGDSLFVVFQPLKTWNKKIIGLKIENKHYY